MNNDSNINPKLENQRLRREFSVRDLDPEKVCYLSHGDKERENRQLQHLLAWVDAYRKLKSREHMEAEGFDFPPIEPDFDPDSDWLVFENWLKGAPTTFSLGNPGEFFLDPDTLSDEQIVEQLNDIDRMLRPHGIQIDMLQKKMPARLVYLELKETLTENTLPLIAAGAYHIDGCTGCCPDCFQRPWCEIGAERIWEEDKEAGKMALPECLRDYVSATPFSLSLMVEEEL